MPTPIIWYRAILRTAVILLSVLCCLPVAHAQAAPPVDPKTIPVIDGGIGPCSADFTVTDSKGAPVYDAQVRVHVAYRFLSAHKLDLEVGTNAAGKARFTGLPEKPDSSSVNGYVCASYCIHFWEICQR